MEPDFEATVAGDKKEFGVSEADETVDFVVVGSGGGSMCASLVMREAGKDVRVLPR